MKILITGTTGESIPPPYAGIPKHSLLLARAWREAGHSVALTFTYARDKADDLGAKGSYHFEYSSVPTRLAKLHFLLSHLARSPVLYVRLAYGAIKAERRISKEILLYASYGVFIDAVICKEKPNIVLSEAALIKTFMVAHVAKLRGVPLAIHTYAEVHDMSMSPNKHLGPRGLAEAYWRSFLGKADMILAPSCYCARGPEAYVPEGKVRMVYFGIDIEPYLASKLPKEEARRQFGLPVNGFYVIAVGAFASRKGHDHLIRAAGITKRRGNPVHVLLCGPGDQGQLRRLALEEGVEGHTHFFTGLSEGDLVALYRAANVYCDASNTPRACLGMSLTEGMAAGLPAIAYDSGGMPEVVRSGENGIIVPTNNVEKLADAIDAIRSMAEEERGRFGDRSREIARTTVDIRVEANLLLRFLATVAKDN